MSTFPARSPRLGPPVLGPAVGVREGLDAAAAPRFDATRGTRAARALKRLVNAALSLPARPQRLFDEEIRALVARWAGLLRELTEAQAVLAAELDTVRGDLARLRAEVVALRGRPSPVLPRASVVPSGSVGCWRVADAPAPGVDVVAAPVRLPFADGSLEELVVPATLLREASATWVTAWRAALRPDGRLRCTPPLGDPDELVPLLVECGFDGLVLERPVDGVLAGALIARRPALD